MNLNVDISNYIENSIKQGSKSFNQASRLFPSSLRRSILMLYAWCRYCDDIIDGQSLGEYRYPRTVNESDALLAKLKESTQRAYGGSPMTEPAFIAFQQVVHEHRIPQYLAFSLLEGFAMDIRGEKYRTLEDTLNYCYHVAGVVGLMIAHILGVHDRYVLDRACDLGMAFQLTNISRDIVEDANNGRCYIPLDWLEAESITAEELIEISHRAVLARLAARLILHAEHYYASARVGLKALPCRSAWAIASAHNIYRAIGLKVQRAGTQAWDQRIQTNRIEKIAFILLGARQALCSRYGGQSQSRSSLLWQRPHV